MQKPYQEEYQLALASEELVCEWWEARAWSARIYSKGQIDRAGAALAAMTLEDWTARADSAHDLAEFGELFKERQELITIVDNWRACHAYPLQVVKMTLLNRARKVDPNALIAQRLKRRPSIEIKLRDNPHMKLSQMHDIGGSRAVLSTVKHVRKLVDKWKEFHAKSPKDRSDWDGSDDFD